MDAEQAKAARMVTPELRAILITGAREAAPSFRIPKPNTGIGNRANDGCNVVLVHVFNALPGHSRACLTTSSGSALATSSSPIHAGAM